MQVLCAVVGADERVSPGLSPAQLAWLARTPLMRALLAAVGAVRTLRARQHAPAGQERRKGNVCRHAC